MSTTPVTLEEINPVNYTSSTSDTVNIEAYGGAAFAIDFGDFAVDRYQSTIEVTASELVAGASAAIVVTIRDGAGNPLPDVTVEVMARGKDVTVIQPTAETNAQGQAVAYLSGTYAPQTVQVTARTVSDNVTLAQTIPITFIPGLSSPNNSTLTVAPTSVVANGSDQARFTVTLRDEYDNPVSGKDVSVTAGTDVTLTQDTTTSDSQGQVTGVVRSSTAGSATLRAIDVTDGITLTQNAVVLFTSADPQASNVVVAPETLIADGTSAATITVTLRDQNNEPLPDKPIELELTGEENYLNGQLATGRVTIGNSLADGTASAVLTSTQVALKSIKAYGDGIPLDTEPQVTFTVGAVDGTLSYHALWVQLTASTNRAAADGYDTIFITVIARDALGHPIPDSTVVLTASSPITFNSFPPTNQTGLSSTNISSTSIGEVVLRASVDGVLLDEQAQVAFVGPDLAVSVDAPQEVIAGFPIDYQLTIENQGLLTATNVLVTDTLPAGTSFISQTSSYPVSYDEADGQVVWQLGKMPPGASESLTLQAQVSPDAPSEITNQLVATLAETDLTPSNNQASQTTQVTHGSPQLIIEPASSGSNPALLSVLHNGGSASTLLTITNQGTAPSPPLLGGTEGGQLSVVGKDYDWLNITPQSSQQQLGIGESLTIVISAPDTLSIGSYYDYLEIQSPNHESLPFYLKVYVHPPLVDLTVPVTNTMGDRVANAQVQFVKTITNTVLVDGSPTDSHPDIRFNRLGVTTQEGQALLSQIEIGNYAYSVTAEGHLPVTGTITVDANTTDFVPPPLQAVPGLVFEPDQALLSITAGESDYITLQIRNTGPGHAENFAVQTPNDLPWISAGLPYSVTQLMAGEAMSVTLFLSPPEEGSEGTYQRVISVSADYVQPAALAATIHVVTSTVGTLEFVINDQEGNPIEGAYVSATNRNGRLVNGSNGQERLYDNQSSTTDANGRALLPDLPVAEYEYYVEADGYDLQTGQVEVLPDLPENNQAGINRALGMAKVAADGTSGEGMNLVSLSLTQTPFDYDWTIEHNPISDTYSLNIKVTHTAVTIGPGLHITPQYVCPGKRARFLVQNIGQVPMNQVRISLNHPGIDTDLSVIESGPLDPEEYVLVEFLALGGDGDLADYGRVEIEGDYDLPNNNTATYETYNNTAYYCGFIDGGINWGWGGDGNGGIIGNGITFDQSWSWPGPRIPPPLDNHRVEALQIVERAQLQMYGHVGLTRQAFATKLKLNNFTDNIDGIVVSLEIRERDSNKIVEQGVYINPLLPLMHEQVPAGYPELRFSWLIVPERILETEHFIVQAHIEYTVNNILYRETTLPVPMTVYPQPYLSINVFAGEEREPEPGTETETGPVFEKKIIVAVSLFNM